MIEAILHAFSCVAVLLCMIGLGWLICQRGWCDGRGRSLIANLVNFALPLFLFHTVTSKFSHERLLELLRLAPVTFTVIGCSFAVSCLLVRLGLVKKERQGTFITASTGSTILFVGIPVITSMFGDEGLPYLLVYFMANVTFVWSIGIYNIQLDGVRSRGEGRPPFLAPKNLKMIFSKPILGFLAGVVFILLDIPVPGVVASITKMFAQLVSPLALVFVGTTIFYVGFSRFRRLELDECLVLAACFVIRPLITLCVTSLFGLDHQVIRILIICSSMPVTPVCAVLARIHGGPAEFASEVIGLSAVTLTGALPVIFVMVQLV